MINEDSQLSMNTNYFIADSLKEVAGVHKKCLKSKF